MKPVVLFICTGNICRSPMAVALLKAKMAEQGEPDRFIVASAGTWAVDNQPASENTRRVLEKRGVRLDTHRGRTVTRAMLDEAAVVLTMTRAHLDALQAEFPNVRAKTHLISELVGQFYDIADPYGGSMSEYEATARELERLIDRGYPRLGQWAAQTAS